MKYFCMPADFKSATIDKYSEINNKYEDSKINETYGQLTVDNIFGSCRAPKDLPLVNLDILEKYIRHCNDKKIEFNYIINATCMENDELTKSGYKKLEEFLKTLESLGVSWVTLSLPSLMEIVKFAAPNLKIKASTVSQINSPLKAKFYEDLGIKRIVLDEDIYRKFDVLKSIRKVFSGDIEIIVNSFCVIDCPFKMFHYNSFSHSNIDKDKYPYYTTRCRSIHTGAENYLKLNWIRPEDIHHYTETGINYFKIQGRTNVYTGDPVKAVTHYIDEKYEGNLISLLELFSESKPLTIAGTEIDNGKLDGFFDKFVESPGFCTKICDQCGYCKTYADKSINNMDAAIMEMMNMFKNLQLDEFPKNLE